MTKEGLIENHSSKNEPTTRVKVKTWKKTVGITLPQNLVEKARIHKLNLSRITEQALTSILDYLETQNNEASSRFLTEGSFLKETSECRGPGLNRRRPGLQPGALPG
jgi:post-segregation antitoxin (ccd killing protein)